MGKKYISQTELAKFIGCSQVYISKLKKKKVFDYCLENGKFLRSKSSEYAKVYEDNKDETRENQRIANYNKKHNIDDSVPDEKIENSSEFVSEGMFDVKYIGGNAQDELNELMDGAKSSVQKIQIKDAFIESKRKENEFKKELGFLIELEEAEALIELISSNMKAKMYSIPNLFKTKYTRMTTAHINFLNKKIDLAFDDFNKFGVSDVRA